MKGYRFRCKEDAELSEVLLEYRRRDLKRFALALLMAAVFLATLAASGSFDTSRYTSAGSSILQILADSLPPDFSRSKSWLYPLWETLSMSIAATFIGAIAAVPLAFFAARNAGSPRILSVLSRTILSAARSVPEVVFGIVFVAAVGFGPLAGVLALSCHSIGFLGKFITENIEHAETAPIEAMESLGITAPGRIRFCIIEQIYPRLIDLFLYRWEHNVRAATAIGIVGGGGIGLEIMAAFSLFEYREAMALLIVIFGLVICIDHVSRILRSNINGEIMM